MEDGSLFTGSTNSKAFHSEQFQAGGTENRLQQVMNPFHCEAAEKALIRVDWFAGYLCTIRATKPPTGKPVSIHFDHELAPHAGISGGPLNDDKEKLSGFRRTGGQF